MCLLDNEVLFEGLLGLVSKASIRFLRLLGLPTALAVMQFPICAHFMFAAWEANVN